MLVATLAGFLLIGTAALPMRAGAQAQALPHRTRRGSRFAGRLVGSARIAPKGTRRIAARAVSRDVAVAGFGDPHRRTLRRYGSQPARPKGSLAIDYSTQIR
jgi:hypothetical protein